MAPAPCLPTGQAEALPPMPKLKRLSTLRRKIPSQGLNQTRRERCGPRVDSQSSVPGQLAPDLPTDAHGRVPTHPVHHRNHTQPAMRTEVPYMQQRIPPVRSQEPVNTARYVSPSGYSTNHLTSPHHTSPPVQSQPLTQHQNQQGLDPSHSVSSQWRSPQHAQAPRPQHGHDSRSSLQKHCPNYSQYFGNAGYQTHEAGGNQRHQPRFPQQMHQFSRPGIQHTQQHPGQPCRQNGPGLQSHAQFQVKGEENHQQYQSQMQMHKPQNHGQNQRSHMQHYHMQTHQQNGQRQHGPDQQYKGQQQVQMGEKHRQPQTKELPLNTQTRTPQNQNQMNHMLHQYHVHNGQKQHGPGLQYIGQQAQIGEKHRQLQTKERPLNTQTRTQQNQVNPMHQYHMQMHRQNGQTQHGPAGQQQVQIGEKPLQAKEHPLNTQTHTQQNQMNRMYQYHTQVYRQNGQKQHGPDQQYREQQQVRIGEKHRQSQTKEHPLNTQTRTQQNQNQMNHQYQMHNGHKQHGPDLQYNGQQQVQIGEKRRQSLTKEHPLNTQTHAQPSQPSKDGNQISKSQQVSRTMEEKELPQETNPQHNQQDVGLSPESPLSASYRMLQNKKFQHERQKIKENESTCNANGAGSPKDISPQDENTHDPPNLHNDNLQSQTNSPAAKTDGNRTQDCSQTNYNVVSTPSTVSENLEETPMVEGHTLLSTDTFLTYLKTSAVKEDNGANYTHTPVSTPHSRRRIKRKTDASFRFIDLLEEDESSDEDTMSPRRHSTSTDHEKEMDYCNEPENNAHPVDKQIDRNSYCNEPENNVPLCSSSPVDKQVDRNSDVENFANNTLREEDRETLAVVTELAGNSQIEDILKLCESILTRVDCDTSFDRVPATLQNHEIETEDCGNLGNKNLIYPSPFYKQDEDSPTDNTNREICEETHTSNILHVNSPTLIGCLTPPESIPATPETQEDEIDKYDEENTLLHSYSPVYKQADRFLHIKNTFKDDTQREQDRGSESPNDSSKNETLGISQCVFSPSEDPSQSGNFQPSNTPEDRLTPPDSDPATPGNQGKETDELSDTEDSLSCSSSPFHTLDDEDTHFENNSSENKQTEPSERTFLSPEFSSSNSKLGSTQGVSRQSTGATPKSGNIRPASKSKPKIIVRAAPPKIDFKASKSLKRLKNRHRKTSKPSEILPKPPAGDRAYSVGALTPPVSEENKLVNGVTPSTPVENNLMNVYTPPVVGLQMNVPQYTPDLTPVTTTCVTPEYTLSTLPMSMPLVGSVTPENTSISGGTSIHSTEVPMQVAADMTPSDMPSLEDACSQIVQTTPENSSAQPTEVSIPPVDANKQLTQTSEQSLQGEETTAVLNSGPANNPSPSHMVHTLPVNTPKLPELKRIRRVRRKDHGPEQPPQKDWVNMYRRRMEEMESQGNHSDVGTTVVPKTEMNHEEQFLQRDCSTASRQDGSVAPDRHSREGSYRRKTVQDDSSAIEHFARSSPDRTKMENGCHKIISEVDLTIDVEPVINTPDEDKTKVIKSSHPASSAPNGTYPRTSHREQIVQRNYSSKVQKASDASAKQKRKPNPPKWISQDSFSGSRFRFDPNAKDGSRVKHYCPQDFKVSDVTSDPPVPRRRHQHKPGTSNQRLANKEAMFMKTDLFLNASDKPKLETKVECLTCCQTVEGGEAYYHMFFGQLKCEKCDKVIASCQDLIPSLGSVETCEANAKRPHHYTRWNISPVDFLCYRLRRQNAEKDGSSRPTFLATLKDMERYLEDLSPLRNIKLWKSAFKKCQAFTKLMLASTRQEEDRDKRDKKRQKSQNTAGKKKQKRNNTEEEITKGGRNKRKNNKEEEITQGGRHKRKNNKEEETKEEITQGRKNKRNNIEEETEEKITE
ncbi:putative mediator of RNA polymerase II transcription subunit 26 isoform X2 [Penaeus vannamei]